jgi:hypothetical protein
MVVYVINTYASLMYELKKIGKIFTSKFVGPGPSSYKKRIYRAAVSQWLRNTGLQDTGAVHRMADNLHCLYIN